MPAFRGQPSNWVYDLPIIGDKFAKLGRIQAIYANPCSPTAEIWVYGFFQAVPTLAASLLKPELIDINIAHRRGKPRKGKRFKFNADIIFRDAIIEIPVPRWVVFRVYEMSQRIGWYFLVADATEDFAINWMTAAYKYNGCQLPLLTYARLKGDHVLMASDNGPLGAFINCPVEVISNIEASPPHVTIVIPGFYRINWTVTFDPYEIPTSSELPYTTMLVCTTAALQPQIGEASVDAQGKIVASGSAFVLVEAGEGHQTFQVRAAFASNGKFCYASLTMSVDLTDQNELSPDP